MASLVATDKIACNWFIRSYDHDPDSTAVKVISADAGTTEIWFDLQDYDAIAFCVSMQAITGSGMTLLEIVASEAADETDASVTIIKTSGVLTITTLAKGAFLECTAEEVAGLCTTTYPNLRYVTARMTNQNAADECKVVVFAHARKPHDAVTAATW